LSFDTRHEEFLNHADLGPSQQLILACLQKYLCNSPALDVKALAQKLTDWSEFRVLAETHGVTSIAGSVLRGGDSAAPESELLAMENEARSILASNLLATGQVAQLLKRCAEESIRILIFKGPALAGEHYEDLGKRAFADIDAFVDKADATRVCDLLRRMNYELAHAMTEQQLAFEFDWRGEAMYRLPNGTCVDLHTSLSASTFSIPWTFKELWDRRRLVVVAGKEMNTFSHEDLALYLAVHGCKHRWERLIWVCDFAKMLSLENAVNWRRVLSNARRLRLEIAFLVAVNVAASLLSAPIPPEIESEVDANRTARRLAQEAMGHLFKNPASFSKWRMAYFHLRWGQRPASVVQDAMARTFLPHPPDWQAMPLPRPFWFLYPVLRPVRLCWKTASNVTQRLFKKY
jgi:hypothetical protein